MQLTGSNTQLQSFAINCCEFLLSSPWFQILDSNEPDFPKEIWNPQFLGSNVQYVKSHPSQLKLSIPDVLFCCSGQWSAMVSVLLLCVIHDRKEKVEIWTESRCLADVEMFQLILLKACRMMGSVHRKPGCWTPAGIQIHPHSCKHRSGTLKRTWLYLSVKCHRQTYGTPQLSSDTSCWILTIKEPLN